MLGVLYFSLHSYLRNICLSPSNKSLEPGVLEQDPSPLPPESRQTAYSSPKKDLQKDIVFNTYSTQPTN